MELFINKISHVSTGYWIQPLTDWKGLDLIWLEQQQTYVFHQFELVNKFNLDTETPRRDTSIQIIRAGLAFRGWGLPHIPRLASDSKAGLKGRGWPERNRPASETIASLKYRGLNQRTRLATSNLKVISLMGVFYLRSVKFLVKVIFLRSVMFLEEVMFLEIFF